MQDVMKRLQGIVEAGYDNEDMQRGIDAAGKHQFDVSEDESVTQVEEETIEQDQSVIEGTEMGTIGDVSVKQFGSGDDQVSIQLTGPDGYVQLSKEEAAQLAARLANWAGSKDIAYPDQYGESATEEGIEEVHEVEDDSDYALEEMLKMAGRSGVLGIVSEGTNDPVYGGDDPDSDDLDSDDPEVKEAVVTIPVQELTDIMKLAGYDNYAEKIEEYANEPEEQYMDAEEQLIGLSGGLNGPKTMHPTAAGGDNAMSVRALDVDNVDETFYKEYKNMIEELKSE